MVEENRARATGAWLLRQPQRAAGFLGSHAGGGKPARRTQEFGVEHRAGVWEDWIVTVSGDDLTPYIELAKHHEWHTLDLAAAAAGPPGRWASPKGGRRDRAREALADLRHRLERLERKLAGERVNSSEAE